MTIVSGVVKVTPEDARNYLKLSKGNRKFRSSWVKVLKGIIQRGEWKLTHQGIAFDQEGALVDGHHRLTAIAESGMAVELMVSHNVSNAGYDAIDMGRRRSFADALKLEKKDAELFYFLARIRHGIGVSTDQILAVANCGVADVHTRLFEYAGKTSKKIYSAAPVRAACVLSILDGQREEYCFSQYKALILLDFDGMSEVTKSFVRQAQSYIITSSDSGDLFARSAVLFDEKNKDVTRVQINEGRVNSTNEWARGVLDRLMQK